MTPVAPRIVNNVSYVTRISHDSHFAWQAQYLVMLNCHFSWQAQYSVKFGMIARARNVAFFNRNARGERPRLRGGLRTDGFMVGSFSDHSRILLGSVAHCK